MDLAFLIYQYFPYGGQQRDFMQVALRCRQAGHRVRVYCLSWQGEAPEGFQICKVPVSAISHHVLYERFSEWVAQALDTEPADCVIGFSKMPGLDVYYAADPCFAERMRRERRWFLRHLPRYRHFLNFEKAVFAEENTQIMLLSPQQVHDFRQHYPASAARCRLLPPGLSADRLPPADAPQRRVAFRKSFGLDDDALAVLQVGSGFRVKGVDRALRALASLPAPLRRRVRYLLVGDGKAARYQKLAAKLGIASQCRFLGGRDDVPDFMAGCDLLLHPAYSESAGYTILEAIINGLPVLTTDTCGYAFHVQQAEAGQVCPSPFRQRDLDARLQEMLVSPDRQQWTENGLAYAAKVNVTGMADEALHVIEQAAMTLATDSAQLA